MKRQRSIFISAGEQSGDLHASGLIAELCKLDPKIVVTGLGGEQLRKQNVDILYHCRDLAALGFWEVFKKIGFFLKVRDDCVKYLRKNKPDLVILVDYPGLNLKLAKAAQSMGIPAVYFILPQVWAWKPKRAYTLKKYCHLLISILPFEEEFFRKYETESEYVGHPLIDLIPVENDNPGILSETELICLLPGSRIQEVERNLAPMIAAMKIIKRKHADLRGMVIRADNVPPELYARIISDSAGFIELADRDKYDCIKASGAAMVASGTATLETAICGTPAVVIYKTSQLTYFLARQLIKIDTIALANLVAGEKVFPELIQESASPERIASEILKILEDENHAKGIRNKLAVIRDKLKPQDAYKRAADLIFQKFLKD